MLVVPTPNSDIVVGLGAHCLGGEDVGAFQHVHTLGSRRSERRARRKPGAEARRKPVRLNVAPRGRQGRQVAGRLRRAAKIVVAMRAVIFFGLLSVPNRSMQSPSTWLPFQGLYRIGEASHPGPYSTGGASSSTDLGPLRLEMLVDSAPRGVFGDNREGLAGVQESASGASDSASLSSPYFIDPLWTGEEHQQGRILPAPSTSPPMAGGRVDIEQRRSSVPPPASRATRLCSFDDPEAPAWEEEPEYVLQTADAQNLAQAPELPNGQVGSVFDPWSVVAQQLFDRDACPASVPPPRKWAHLGTEADRAAARQSRCVAAMAEPRVEHMPVALPSESLTPAEALERRAAMIQQRQEERREVRLRGRKLRSAQEVACRRPKRPPPCSVIVGTANGNSFAAIRDELLHGHVLPQVHYLAVQEHLCRGEACDRASRDARSAGWDAVLSPAYVKASAPGGGTAVLALHGRGAIGVPVPQRLGAALEGRCTASFIDVLGGILFVSYYGISGKPIAGQLQTLAALGQLVKGCGLPFVIAGDWQVSPAALAESKFPHRMGAEIMAPEGPTNLRSGSTLDYFVISRSISAAVSQVQARHDLYLSPHVPVIASIATRSKLGVSYALSQPRVLPVGHPQGPVPRPASVDWGALDADADTPSGSTERLEQWFAGAELELMGVFGLQGSELECEYMGLGSPGHLVSRRPCGRFAGSPDQLGLIGQRLAWSARSAKAVALLATALPVRAAGGPRILPSIEALTCSSHKFFLFPDDGAAAGLARGLVAVGRRAAAFAAELKRLNCDEVLRPFLPELAAALQTLASVARPYRGSPPLISSWSVGARRETILMFEDVAVSLAAELTRAAALKRQRDLSALKQWARTATLKQAHSATKPSSFVAAHSASPSKAHRGELTPQAAADAGREAWARVWKAADEEVAGLMDRVLSCAPGDGDPPSSFFAVRDGPFVPIELPSITGDSLRVALRSFRHGTAVGLDWVRLRHLALLSQGALNYLASLLEAFEREARLPKPLAGTVSVAIAKKSGGSRLIGVATALYRVWSRVRYGHMRDELEARLSRSFLAAAPMQGAQSAVAELALRAEQAQLKGHESAAALVDISKFYESLSLEDIAVAAHYFGVPRCVLSLCIDFYLAPRYIRVARSWARPLYPTRSIVAGCTWATVLIRCFIIGPADRFLKDLSGVAMATSLSISLKIYVDDVTLLISAALHRLREAVRKVSSKLLAWISHSLRLTVAQDKLVCIVSSAETKAAIGPEVASLGYAIHLVAPCLGADFSAGGIFRARPSMWARVRTAFRRRSKVRWWRRLGGDARSVARGGLVASGAHAAEVSGIPPAAMRDLRRAVAAATPVQAVGASLTARLAVGGEQAAEADPRVLMHNPPLKFLLGWLWDHPEERQQFVLSWHDLRAKSRQWSTKEWWKNIRGPLSAAWAHLVAVDMDWVSPFLVRSRGVDVQFLDLAPKRSYQLLAEHVRILLDTELLDRHMEEFLVDPHLVLDRYAHGIDWDSLRLLLAPKRSPLSPVQRRALGLVVTGALWEEYRKWLAGYLPSASCLWCFSDAGTKEHRLRECPGVVYSLDWARVAGEILRESNEEVDPALAPLRLFGWPPAAVERMMAPSTWIQGELVPGMSGRYFGDGSCLWPQARACETAAWALVFEDGENFPGLSSSLPGPFATSFRGELAATVQFFRVAGRGSSYTGDCKSVIDAINTGIPDHLCAASTADADLWVKLRTLVRLRKYDDLSMAWVKAHRSRAAAEKLGRAALRDWAGNDAADRSAKEAAGRRAVPSRFEAMQSARRLALRALCRLAHAASVGLDRGAGIPRRKRPLRARLLETRPGGHRPVALGGGAWRCQLCRVRARTKASLRTFRAVPCKGLFLARAHSSHALQLSRGLVWCGACGAYAVEKMVGLTRVCPGHPPSAAARQRLTKLRRGAVPLSSVGAANALSGLEQPSFRAQETRGSSSAASPLGVYLRLQPEVAAARQAAHRPGGTV